MTKGDKKICLNKADSELYVICDVQNSGGYPTLRNGSRGIYVLVLQDALNALGYSTKTLDGAFGSNTRSALLSFQRNNGLNADGICGCCSWRRIVSEAVGIGRTLSVIDPYPIDFYLKF